MKYDYDKEIIRDAIGTIKTPEYDIMSKVKKNMEVSTYPMNIRKKAVITLVTCMCFMFTMGVGAIHMPIINDFIYRINPNIALIFQPICISSEDQGIEMKVIGAINDDEMAIIYVSMRDLIGDRIDETLDLYDFSFTGANMYNSQIGNYDKDNKTAIMRIQGNGGKEINGKKVSFSIESFISKKKIFDGIDGKINLSQIEKAKETQLIQAGGGGGKLYNDLLVNGKVRVLQTDKINISIPKIDFMSISNIGYVDDLLHIQTRWTKSGIDDHGYFYFVNEMGEKIYGDVTNYYFKGDENSKKKSGYYIEYVFNVKNIDLNKAKLKGYFVTDNNYTQGNWKTTFKIQSVVEEKKEYCNIKLGKGTINRVSISPLGVTLVGDENIELEKANVKVSMLDNKVEEFNSSTRFESDDEVKIKFISSKPLDISKVKSIKINDEILKFNY
ncbi:MAG: DUF4179 domain-containing protein [Anaeromicrobium sp.]|jgi:hypothetical protein|uniref:DUF4179 domain-containing protein n=1 Tax=Anaeromicrobium sp. TaxID=1929132 RepID=UPI0025F8F808|nr:DUF4179 domain-containing protein [Anaeromicrobium sp.]MCT4593843.1 DUF4179 domain-containing protein [Anaeromicrobium sp.]